MLSKNKNKHWFILILSILGWTIISFLIFWENINLSVTHEDLNKIILGHFFLWIVGASLLLSLVFILNSQKSKIEKLNSNQNDFYALFNFFNSPAFLYDKVKNKIIKANNVAISNFNIEQNNDIYFEITELNCLIEQLVQYKHSTIRNMKMEISCPDSKDSESNFDVILHDIHLNENLVTLIIVDSKRESEKNIEEMNDYIEDLHAKEDALEDNAFELIQLNMKLEESENSLKEANESKDKFFSIVAHDLKSPFVGLLGITEMLDSDYDDFDEKEKRELIRSLFDISKNTFELLEGLLEWARAKQGRMEYNPKEFNLFKVADSLANLLRANAFKKEISIQNKVDINATVYGDREMVATILRNLLANAIKFTPKNGIIEVKSEIENNLMKVSVRDSGIGMSEESIEKLFRIDVNHTTLGTNNEKGTGLGLILCKELIEKHGTSIWVESELDKGSLFSFTLPLSKNTK